MTLTVTSVVAFVATNLDDLGKLRLRDGSGVGSIRLEPKRGQKERWGFGRRLLNAPRSRTVQS